MGSRIAIIASALLLIGAVGFFGVAPRVADDRMNRVHRAGAKPAGDRARALHARAFVADMHADTLLWGRDVRTRSGRGHVDLPRLREGNVQLQIFDVVTKTPKKMNIERNSDKTDNIKLLAAAQRWPIDAQNDLMRRATFQAERLHAWVADNDLVFVDSAAALRDKGDKLGVMLGLEGAHALSDLADVETLYDNGFRLIGLAHFFDNAWAGSAHGEKKHGLTEKGRALVAALEGKKMLVDLAHASPATVDDTLTIAKRPVVVSHTGVRGTCDTARNLSDAQLKRIAANGGIIGIGFFDNAVCGQTAGAIVKAIAHACDVMGDTHVALGSDFDGAVGVPFDVSQLSELTEAMLAAGFSDNRVIAVLGGNLRAFLLANL